jgi:ribosome-associated translation inhibitor RaiA
MNANADKDYIDAKTEAVRSGMDGRLEAFQAEVNAKFIETNSRIDALAADVNVRFAETNARIDALAAEVNVRFAETNARIDKLEVNLNAKIETAVAELRKDIAELSSRMVQWMVGTFIATIAIFITVMTFVLNNAIPKVAPAAPATPAPIVIQLPPQVWTPQPAPAPQQKP